MVFKCTLSDTISRKHFIMFFVFFVCINSDHVAESSIGSCWWYRVWSVPYLHNRCNSCSTCSTCLTCGITLIINRTFPFKLSVKRSRGYDKSQECQRSPNPSSDRCCIHTWVLALGLLRLPCTF